ncbi:MAG: cytochrome P460 family protein [Pyrinomonadaceae bacterium]
MLRRKQIIALGAVVLFFAGGVGAFVSVEAQKRARAGASRKTEEQGGLDLFAEHRSWARVNPAPARMDPATAALCRAPTPVNDGRGTQGPHQAKYLDVYVNPVGAKAMTGEDGAEFPRGSIIVKEKLARPGDDTVELMTAMVKREAGFNPESGDWEYFVVNGAGTQIQARGRLDNCTACHVGRKELDYTFRTYLPSATFEQVRQQAARHQQ